MQGCSSEQEAPSESSNVETQEITPVETPAPEVADNIIKIAPGPDVQEELQEALTYHTTLTQILI